MRFKVLKFLYFWLVFWPVFFRVIPWKIQYTKIQEIIGARFGTYSRLYFPVFCELSAIKRATVKKGWSKMSFVANLDNIRIPISYRTRKICHVRWRESWAFSRRKGCKWIITPSNPKNTGQNTYQKYRNFKTLERALRVWYKTYVESCPRQKRKSPGGQNTRYT